MKKVKEKGFSISWLIIKIVIIFVMLFAYSIIKDSVLVELKNSVAIAQMSSSFDSSAGIRLYDRWISAGYFVILIVSFLMFRNEIVILLRKIKQQISGGF